MCVLLKCVINVFQYEPAQTVTNKDGLYIKLST